MYVIITPNLDTEALRNCTQMVRYSVCVCVLTMDCLDFDNDTHPTISKRRQGIIRLGAPLKNFKFQINGGIVVQPRTDLPLELGVFAFACNMRLFFHTVPFIKNKLKCQNVSVP